MKRRSFLGAIAAVFAAPKLLEAKPELTLADMLRVPPLTEDEWIAQHTINPAKEPVTICPNCGRFRTEASRAVIVKAPGGGVGALSDSDYIVMPTTPEYVDGCLRCAEDEDDRRVGYHVGPRY